MNSQLVQSGKVWYLARAGGGGSSSHSSGGSRSSSSSSRSSSSHSSSSGGSANLPWWGTMLVIFACFGLPIIIIILISKFGKVASGAVATIPQGYIDTEQQGTAEEQKLSSQAQDVFMTFQLAWSTNSVKQMQKILHPYYYQKIVLELSVLRNYGRRNDMQNVTIQKAALQRLDDYTKGFRVFFVASAKDTLVDTKANTTLYTDTSTFSEIWSFVPQGKKYVLSDIAQTTAESSKYNAQIAEFANEQGFYYDIDFGWLMMPTRGAIFGPTGFGNADINNHVIGYYQDKKRGEKLVEFYSYEPKAGVGLKPFVVAQAILPRSYDDILVTEKSWYDFKPKAKGLTRIETESVEFNKKFAVWAADRDKATSFELLATNFMERIYALDFEVNIEVVDNVLYLYSPSGKVSYQELLDVLSWAFEEMKM